MIEKIKAVLLRNPYFYIIDKARKDPEYKAYCLEYDYNGTIFRFEHLGDLNFDKNIYILREGGSYQGMFSILTWTLRRLEVADRLNMIPVVTWKKESPVNLRGAECENPFELYFQPVSDINLETALNSAFVVKSKRNDGFRTKRKMSYDFTDDEIDRLSIIYSKYIHLQPEIEDKIYLDIKKISSNSEKILGVHVRGVDWRNNQVKYHPIPITENEFLLETEKLFNTGSYDCIFLATDSDDTVDLFKNRFGEKIRIFEAKRTPTNTSSLVIFDTDNDQYNLGCEVLRDAYMLANCDALVCGMSYVSYVARIIKKSMNSNYDKVLLLNKGRSLDGVTVQDAEKLQRRLLK